MPSTSYAFELAQPSDEPKIRELLRQIPVPGSIELTYEREPDYFLGCSIMGSLCQTLVARSQDGAVVGIATRSLRTLYVNGKAQTVGYIGKLRIAPEHRGRWILPQGFRLFHKIHQDGQSRGYITTIIEGNVEAEGLLVTKARRHYPRYRLLDRLVTLALVLHRWLPSPQAEASSLEGGEREELIAFFERVGSRRQFFPALTPDDLGCERTRGLGVADILVIRRKGRIVGSLALWDQRTYKQTRIHAYSPGIRLLRPILNRTAPLLGISPLPPPGESIPSAHIAFICIEEDDPQIFDNLLLSAAHRARASDLGFLALGLSARDPLLPVARRRLQIPYYSRLFSVCWAGDEAWHESLDGRIPYVEIATL